jgi:hypothetical protein
LPLRKDLKKDVDLQAFLKQKQADAEAEEFRQLVLQEKHSDKHTDAYFSYMRQGYRGMDSALLTYYDAHGETAASRKVTLEEYFSEYMLKRNEGAGEVLREIADANPDNEEYSNAVADFSRSSLLKREFERLVETKQFREPPTDAELAKMPEEERTRHKYARDQVKRVWHDPDTKVEENFQEFVDSLAPEFRDQLADSQRLVEEHQQVIGDNVAAQQKKQ